jgi:hypothetical protein
MDFSMRYNTMLRFMINASRLRGPGKHFRFNSHNHKLCQAELTGNVVNLVNQRNGKVQ